MKRIITGIALLLAAITISASPISREQAQNIAKSFLRNRGIEMTATKVAFKATKTENVVSEDAYYYIFNAGQERGFVIVSGDDATEQILGYSDKGDFDETTMPDNMRSWLQHYADEMKYLETHRAAIPEGPAGASVQTKAQRKSSPTRHFIPTLMTSTWNQSSPYNDKCPVYYNGDGTTGTSATGCVATALAQVLYFYKHPDKTKTAIPSMSNTYYLNDGTTETVSLPEIKSETEIDWANMVDNYTGNETQEQKDAVAELMLMCGQAVRMGYGSSSGAAFGDNIPEMYKTYFDFDEKAYAAERDDYTISEWFNLLYNELDTGHPIPMAGYSTGGGHAFVIDGFDGDECFHLNWGWGGYCDGYFLISVMNPNDNSGIGSSNSSDGYSMGECVIIGLDLPDEETTESRTHLTITDTNVKNKKVTSNYINWTGSKGTFNYNIVMADENGELVPVCGNQSVTLDANTYINYTFNLNGKITTPGTYRLSPASKLQENSIWRPELNMNLEYIEVIVDENGATQSVAYHNPEENLEITDWNFVGTLASGKEQEVKVTFKNNGDEYFREVHAFASTTDTKSSTDCRCAVVIKEGQTGTFSFYFTPDEEGDWNIWLCTGSDGSGEIGKTTVSISSTAQNEAKLAVNGFSIKNNSYGNCLVGSVAILNNGTTDYNGKVKLQLWKYNPDDGYCWGCGSQMIDINAIAGGSGSGSFDFENLVIGGQYFISVYYTTQDDELDGGGLTWSHEWTLKEGYLVWNSSGTISGYAIGNSTKIASSVSGALFNGVQLKSLTPNSNTNTIYAFANGAEVPSVLDGHNVVNEGVAENITIVEGKPLYSPVAFTAKKATYSHTFTLAGDGEKGWEAITLPFRPCRVTIDGNEVEWKKGDNDGTFWLREFRELTDDNEVVFADVENFDAIHGNTPYVIAAPEEYVGKTIVFEGENADFTNTGKDNMLISSDAFRFYGTTLNKRQSNIYIMNATGDAYEFTAESKTLNPFKNYFVWKLDDASRPARIKISQEATGIKNVNPELKTQDSRLYDLQGREVINPAKGLYIKNGKTIIIR